MHSSHSSLMRWFAARRAAAPAFAQQRPLQTEDPETIGAGRILIEAGLDYNRDVYLPVSGLRGNLSPCRRSGSASASARLPRSRSIGACIRSSASRSRCRARRCRTCCCSMATPPTTLVTSTSAPRSGSLGETARRPAIGSWFSTRLPNAGNESGLGKDVQDFASALTIGKTVQSVRVVANIGLMMIGKPTEAVAQDDLLIYSLSVARAISPAAEVVGEFVGRANFANIVTPGAEDRGLLRFGDALHRSAACALDAGILLGLTAARSGIRIHRRLHLGLRRVQTCPDAVGRQGPRVRQRFPVRAGRAGRRRCGSTSCRAACASATRASAATASSTTRLRRTARRR